MSLEVRLKLSAIPCFRHGYRHNPHDLGFQFILLTIGYRFMIVADLRQSFVTSLFSVFGFQGSKFEMPETRLFPRFFGIQKMTIAEK